MSKRKQYVYLATNGADYDWDAYAVFATREEAERYVELFGFAHKVEKWEIADIPMDPDIRAWSCRYDMDGENMRCYPNALIHTQMGKVDGHKGKNRGTSVYAKTEDEAMEKAKAIIAKKDGGA